MPRRTPVIPRAAHLREKSQLAILRDVLPFLWPQGRLDLKWRVVVAFVALVAAKVVTVITPFAFKYAVDDLTALARPGQSTTAVAMVAVPVAMILAYGFGRIMMVALAQLRDAFFAKVGQHAVREVALRTFRHLHALSLRFHLERRTGGLSRVIERGTRGIDAILRYSLFNSVPTAIELAFVCAILTWKFGWLYAAVTGAMVVVYIGYTYLATEWRINIRRNMNDADTDANTKSLDSLLNFETVKYFGNEEHESARFDRSMARYERAAVKSWTSLAVLNAGQTAVFSVGLTVCMWLAARGIAAGTMTIGDFVMVNAMLIQLYMPLNFLGSVYRELKQGIIDIEAMFDLLDVPPDIVDKPGATALEVPKGEIEFDRVSFSYDPLRPIIKDISFDSGRPPGGHRRAVGAGKSTISRLLFRFYDVTSGAIRIDGHNIADATQKSLRAAIGMVPQIPCCSTTPSVTTSATAGPMHPTPRSRPPPGWPRSTNSSRACRRATMPWWANPA